MNTVLKIDLGEKKLNEKFKFKYPLDTTSIKKVEPGCGCTSYAKDATHIIFTIHTPTEFPFQIKTETWVKHLSPKVIMEDASTFTFEIKYYIKNEYN